MKYYRVVYKSINATNDYISFGENVNYYFVSDSINLRYLRRIVRRFYQSNDFVIGDFAVLFNYDPGTGIYNLLDVFRIGII